MLKKNNNNNNIQIQEYKQSIVGVYLDRETLQKQAVFEKIEHIEKAADGNSFQTESERLGWDIDGEALQTEGNVKPIAKETLKVKLGISTDTKFAIFSEHVHQRISNPFYEQLTFHFENKDLLPQLEENLRFFHVQTIKPDQKYIITACPGNIFIKDLDPETEIKDIHLSLCVFYKYELDLEKPDHRMSFISMMIMTTEKYKDLIDSVLDQKGEINSNATEKEKKEIREKLYDLASTKMECPDNMEHLLRVYGVIWGLIFDLKQTMQLLDTPQRTQRVQSIFTALDQCGREKVRACLNDPWTTKIILGAAPDLDHGMRNTEATSLKNVINELRSFYGALPLAQLKKNELQFNYPKNLFSAQKYPVQKNFYRQFIPFHRELTTFLADITVAKECTVNCLQDFLNNTITKIDLNSFRDKQWIAEQFFNKKEKLVFKALLNYRSRNNNLIDTLTGLSDVMGFKSVANSGNGELIRGDEGEQVNYLMMALKIANVLSTMEQSEKHEAFLHFFIKFACHAGGKIGEQPKDIHRITMVEQQAQPQSPASQDFKNKLNNLLLSPSPNNNRPFKKPGCSP